MKQSTTAATKPPLPGRQKPTPPPKPIEPLLRRLLTRHLLERIDFSVSERHVHATAYAQPHSRVLVDRWQGELRALARQGQTSFSIEEAMALRETSWAKPLASAGGADLATALSHLDDAIRAALAAIEET